MIDYLEALLEEEIEREEESPLSARRVRMAPAVGREPVSGEKPPDGEEVVPVALDGLACAAALPQTGDPAREVRMARPEEPGLPDGETGRAGELPVVLRGRRQAAWAALSLPEDRTEREETGLYGALRRAAQAARAGRGGGRTLSLPLPQRAVFPARLTLTDIDRAVQRDARRFDGGYTLY